LGSGSNYLKRKTTVMAEVVAICWPEEREDAARFAAAGVAVLYLVRADDDPPIPTGCLEDWVRIPGDYRDLQARVSALELRAALHQSPPYVDSIGRFHYRGRIVPLKSTEARLAVALTARFGAVVSDEELLDAVRDVTSTPAISLRVEIGRLRSRVRELHLAIRRLRHGYVLLPSE
jgi:Transcriptional regulatory protein, C terminal